MKEIAFFINVALLIVSVCGNFDKSAKFITKNGNLIIEPALGRNVSIRLRGGSRFTLNNVDVLSALSGLTNLTQIGGLVNRGFDNGLETGGNAYSILDQLNTLRRDNERMQNSTKNFNAVKVLKRTRNRVKALETRVQQIEQKLRQNKCESNPCGNGGTCVEMFDHFLCHCPKQFEGPTCEKDVNECALFLGTDLGCQNGAQCVNHHGSYSCVCASGWFGIHCTQRSGDCLKSSGRELCGHGTCVSANDDFGYKCVCDQGWKTNGVTPACNTDVNECTEGHPKCESMCINLPGSFSCGPCPPGFTGNGFKCSDLNECDLNNGGCSTQPMVHCLNTLGSFHCGECPMGWGGDGRTCTRKRSPSCNICHPSAICAELINGETSCSCPPGMTGRGIGPRGCRSLPRTACSSNPCKNGGVCAVNGTSYSCSCRPGYLKPNCTLNNLCQSSPCKNGGQCSTDGLTYTCTCPSGYTGKSCEKQRNRCGGMLNSLTGHLKFPPEDVYDHNTHCVWLLHTDENMVLNVTFSKFKLESSLDCRYDWLQIHDGRHSAAQMIGRFCGDRLPKGGNIISSRNELYIWFRSDNSTASDGFEFNWNSIAPVCGGTIDVKQHGTISSPGWPGNYPTDRDCKWLLKAPNDRRIQLTFSGINIGTRDNCNEDYVAIYDGITSEGILQEKWCSTANPAPMTIPSNEVLVHFHSSSLVTDTGFQMHFSTVERIPGCGGTFNLKRGEVKSPDGTDGLISCEYSIKLAKGLQIDTKFDEFNMLSDDCVEMWDGSFAARTFIDRWCGSLHPPSYRSVTNEILLKFHSSGRSNFVMSYKTACQYVFENSTGVITSPNYPEDYPGDESCSYEILAPLGKSIRLQFTDFKLEHKIMNKCWFDYLEIIDGPLRSSGDKYCGEDDIPVIVSKTNVLNLLLSTDMTSHNRGFKANYTFIDHGDCGGILRKANGSIVPPRTDGKTYDSDLDCTWVILAPVGSAIELSFSSFDTERESTCFSDYVEIFEGFEKSRGKSLGRYCGNNRPPAFIVHKNALTLKFQSDNLVSGSGFVANYRFVDISKSCGGNIVTSGVGTIRSPNWPGNYTNYVNCEWTITGPSGNQLELSVKSFDLLNSTDCSVDFLEIRNGASKTSPLIGKFCGKSIPKTFTSHSRNIYMRFVSNSTKSANGFEISWDGASTGCGGQLTFPKGVIISPNYPQPYDHRANCEWRINVNKGSTIDITIDDIDMESNSFEFDYLAIYNGASLQTHEVERFSERSDAGKKLRTTGNAAILQFVSDWSISGRGFSVSYEMNCHNNLTDLMGAIESPNFPDRYPADLACRWTIMAPKGNQIALQFTYLDLNKNQLIEGDPKDELLIIDGNTTLSQITDTFTSKSNIVTLDFRSYNGNGGGFQMEYQMQGCIFLLTDPSGQFGTLKYPQMYDNDMECIWHIEVEFEMTIKLNILDMDIENSPNCTNDGLRIYSGVNETDHIVQYCGKHRNLTVTSQSNVLNVKFYSNEKIRAKGFQATYETQRAKCGGIITSSASTLTSPHYPRNYEPNTNCEWLLTVSDHHTMNITFEELDLDSIWCYYDYLTFYDGPVKDPAKLIKKVCDPKQSQQFTSYSNTMLVVFQTDDSEEAKGFKFSFQENCGQEIMVEETGDFRYYSTQSNQNECVWVLTAANPNNHVTFMPTHVEFTNEVQLMPNKSKEDCDRDGIKVYEGSTNPVLKTTFCKDLPSTGIVSSGRSLTIRLPANTFSQLEGILSQYDNHCGGELHTISGRVSSPRYPEPYPTNAECIWTIVSNPGNTIRISFDVMDIQSSESCNQDYLEIRKDGPMGPLLGSYCGSDVPEQISGLNQVWVKFRSDEDGYGRGFLLSYSYAKHNELNTTSGDIQSPKYPNYFSSQQPYTWRIIVPVEHLILLHFIDFTDAVTNSVQLYDGYDETAELIETPESVTVTSSTSALLIKAWKGPFHLKWDVVSKKEVRENITSKADKCGDREVLLIGQLPVVLTSPGYPDKYDQYLQCNWTLKAADPSKHVTLSFKELDLDKYDACYGDHVALSESANMVVWKNTQKLCKKKQSDAKVFAGTPFLRLLFNSYYGPASKGFSASLGTQCGSLMTAPTGTIYIANVRANTECIWQIQVRVGRRIRFSFPVFQMRTIYKTSEESFLIIKNGMSASSPNLGQGKYSLDQSPAVPMTTANNAYVKFRQFAGLYATINMTYEEVMDECSFRIEMTNSSSTVVKSTNYPQLPTAHSECVWTIVAPVGRVVSIHFEDSFELTNSPACEKEYVQLNDGATDMARVIGRYCGNKRPNSVYSTGSVLRIKHFTDVSEPKMGFKATVQLGVCGGSFHSTSGSFIFPGSLSIAQFPTEEVTCDYRIYSDRRTAINLTLYALDLPTYLYKRNCTNHNRIELYTLTGHEEKKNPLIDPICEYTPLANYVIDNDNVLIRFVLYRKESLPTINVKFNTYKDYCMREIKASEGVIRSPGYPVIHQDSVRLCTYYITVPKGRRVKLEFLDFDLPTPGGLGLGPSRLSIGNDLSFVSRDIFNSFQNNSFPTSPLYSTDNVMSVKVGFSNAGSTHRGYKLRFSSEERSTECPQDFSYYGQYRFRNSNASVVYCKTRIEVQDGHTASLHFTNIKYERKNVSSLGYYCSPPLTITTDSNIVLNKFCSNSSQTAVLPFSANLVYRKDIKELYGNISYDVDFKRHYCGGVLNWPLKENINISLPIITSVDYGELECAWQILTHPRETREINLTITHNFQGNCDEEYVAVHSGLSYKHPRIAKICGDSNNANVINKKSVFVHYYSAKFSNKSSLNIRVKPKSTCGSTLVYPFPTIDFREEYQNNVECIWTISANTGFHVALEFVNRFFIESSENCTKDSLQIEQQVNGDWLQVQTLCGRNTPPIINTNSTDVRVTFRSNEAVTADGFSFKARRECGGTFYVTDKVQTLSGPRATNGMNCTYTFIAKNKPIRMNFKTFNLFSTYNCLIESLTVIRKKNRYDSTPVITRHCSRSGLKELVAFERVDVVFKGLGIRSLSLQPSFVLEYSLDTCGGQITNSTSISVELGPHSLSDCFWNISAPENYKIAIHFSNFKFQSETTDCILSFVEVFEGPRIVNDQRLLRICDKLPDPIPRISVPSNKATIHSRIYQSGTRSFQANIIMTPKCDKKITLTANSKYDLDEFTNGYADNQDCSYVFKAPDGYQLKFEFKSFHVENCTDCSCDYLEILDGAGPFASTISKFCGHSLPPTVKSSRNSLYVHFVSDVLEHSQGFSAKVSAVPTLCGASNLSIPDGKSVVISSPNILGNYPPNTDCYWKLTANADIQLHFEKLDIQGPDSNSSNCVSDYLNFYNHPTFERHEGELTSNMIYSGRDLMTDSNLLHTYCGNKLPGDFYSLGGEVFLRFHSDSLVQKSGFKIVATTEKECVRNYTQTHGNIQFTYQAQNCTFLINAPTNYSISLYYNNVYFLNKDCGKEFLEVFDAKTNSSLQKFCGDQDSLSNLFTTKNSLKIKYSSITEYNSFDMSFLASKDGPGCSGDIVGTRGLLTNPFYPDNVRNDSDCRWNIHVPFNMKVSIVFKEFNMGSRTTCKSDYLQFIEAGANGSEEIVRQFCGDDNPASYVSRGNVLSIRFKKTVNYDGNGWAINYRAIPKDQTT